MDPDFTPPPPPATIQEAREKGRIVWTDGINATVQMTQGLFVSFVGVVLDFDGKPMAFIPRKRNGFVRYTSGSN